MADTEQPAVIEGVVCGVSHIPIEDHHPVEHLRGKLTIELACDSLPDPLFMSSRWRLVPIGDHAAEAAKARTTIEAGNHA